MQDQINEIRNAQKEHGEMITKMYSSFIGDEFREGIIHEVKKNSEHRRKSLRTNGFIGGFFVVLGVTIGKFWGKIF